MKKTTVPLQIEKEPGKIQQTTSPFKFTSVSKDLYIHI